MIVTIIAAVYVSAIVNILLLMYVLQEAVLEISFERALMFGLSHVCSPREDEDGEYKVKTFQVAVGPIVFTLTYID